MECNVEDIKKDVRLILAENEDISALISDSSVDDFATRERDTLIEGLICKAIDRVHLYAPASMIRDVSIIPEDSYWEEPAEDDKCNRLIVSDTFLCLNFVRLPDWRVPVYELTDTESEEYTQAQSPFEIMRPSLRHPMVALVKDTWYDDDMDEQVNGVVIEAYPKTINKPKATSTGTGSTNTEQSNEYRKNTHCYVVNKAAIDYDEESATDYKKVLISMDCYDAVLYTIANLYYTSINENDKATAMANEVADILGIKENSK